MQAKLLAMTPDLSAVVWHVAPLVQLATPEGPKYTS
jgi:hypothetical protein